MKLGLISGMIAGAVIFAMVSENQTPGSTKPVMENTRTATYNAMFTGAGMVDDAASVAAPLFQDLRTQFNQTFPGAGDALSGQATHPQP
jgi:hypothetical protein